MKNIDPILKTLFFFVNVSFWISSLTEAFDDDNERIIGGENAVKDEFPWFATTLNRYGSLCGGSLIAPHWILSASHCQRESIGRGDGLITNVIVSQYNRTDPNDGSIKRVVVGHYQHPKFEMKKNNVYVFDLALLKLDRPITEVKPVTIKKEFQESNTDALHIGFGDTDRRNKKYSESIILQKVMLPLIPNDNPACNVNQKGKPFSNNICTFDPSTRKDGCMGDSGGALLSVEEKGRQYFLIGVSSAGGGFVSYCADPTFGAMYARVSQGNGYEWIQDTICNSDKPDPNLCDNNNNTVPKKNSLPCVDDENFDCSSRMRDPKKRGKICAKEVDGVKIRNLCPTFCKQNLCTCVDKVKEFTIRGIRKGRKFTCAKVNPIRCKKKIWNGLKVQAVCPNRCNFTKNCVQSTTDNVFSP